MKKEVKKSKGMSMFKRLSLGAMICGYITIAIALVFVIMSMTKVSSNAFSSKYLIIGAAAALVATGVLGIAQAVEGRYYGDVFGKMTRRNVTIMITVFMSACVACAGLGYGLDEIIGGEIGKYVSFAFYGLAVLSFIGHTITSTLIVAKAK